MTANNPGSTALALAPKTRTERLFSRLTLGHLLGATLLSGAMMGALVTQALDTDPPERVAPSLVFHWNFGMPHSLDTQLKPSKIFAVGDTCESGAFLGIEFRRDIEQTQSPWEMHRHSIQHLYRAHARVGVRVLNVLHGTAAEAMGLLPGDVIVEMDDVALRSASQLAHEIQSRCIGENTVLRVHRKNQIKVLTGALRSRFSHRCGLD